MKNKELLPCPFCGGEAEMFPMNIKPQYGYWVVCSNCGAEQPQYKTKEESIKAWNTRTNTIPVGNGEDYEVTHNDR
ncbi:MAG: Lar family restriction alleviation protein [Oscillospiraceae bacterium]|nr:Lar family restriction alleviation protein [Oscillospiraceae bacterium]